MSESTARLLALAPSLRGSWIVGVLFVLVLAELAANSSAGGIAAYMALAPVLPLISVAAAFGGEMDPSREMVGAAPYPVLRLLVVRTCVVVVSTLVPAAGLAFLLPGSTLLALAWLLPSLALTATVLITSPRVSALPVAGVLASAWMGIVMAGWVRQHDPYLAATPAIQSASAAVVVAAFVLLLVRRDNVAEQIRRAS